MLSCNIGNYLIKHQSQRHMIMEIIVMIKAVIMAVLIMKIGIIIMLQNIFVIVIKSLVLYNT